MSPRSDSVGRATLDKLWPAPASARPTWSPFGDGVDYLAVPSPRRPRLLVPVDVRGADRLLLRHGGGRRTRAGRAAWRTAQRSGLARWAPVPRLRVVPAADGIEAYLSQVLGQPVRIGVLLGPPRANLKPVLAIYAGDPRAPGRVLGFAKVATTQVTAPLLAAEAAALRLLARSPVAGVVAPQLMHHGTWGERDVLVTSALPLAQTGRRPSRISTDVVAGIARVDGLAEQPLLRSDFWREHAGAVELPAGWRGVDATPLRRMVDAVPDVTCLMGSWHGDLGPWNAARGTNHVEIWDWERFATGVPAGLDAVHWPVQVALASGASPGQAWQSVRESVGECLDSLQRTDSLPHPESLQRSRSDPAVVTAAYLLAVLDRYRRDAAEAPTPALLGRVGWLCELADVVASALEEGSR